MDNVQCVPIYDSDRGGSTVKSDTIWAVAVLTVLTIFGLIIRLYHLDWQCLTVDEMITYRVVAHPLMSLVFWMNDYNPPLYYIIAHISEMIYGGITTFSIRFPAMLFGAAVIPAMYFLGNELRNKTLGVLLAGISSFLFPFVYYSQNARAYSLVMFAFIIYTILFIRAYRGDTNRGTVVALLIMSGLCIISHFYSVIPVVISWGILAKRRRELIPYLVGIAALLSAVAILYVPAIISHFQQLPTLAHTEFWLTPIQITMMLPNELFCWSWLVVIPLAAYSILKQFNHLHFDLFLISVLTVLSCIPMTFFISMSPRYALLVSPVILAVAFYPVSEWIDNQKTVNRKVALLAMVLFGMFLFNYGSLLSWYTFNICPYF
jgi:uncharacterized membrane protein